MVKSEERRMVKSGGGSISMVHVRLKLVRLIHRHQQMKASFNNLRSQIRTGLIEAEDVFASLSIPLMKLVGLKTDQMAKQGISATILTGGGGSQPQVFRRNAPVSSTARNNNKFEQEGERFNTSSGTGKKLIQQQRHQLQQLVNLLRRIESRVNSRQNNLLDTLEQHQFHLHNLFQNSIRYLTQQQHVHDQPFLLLTLKLLHTTFKHVASALTSVHNGVEDLITELAQHMCTPMTDFAKTLKADMDAGALIRLVALVENMEGALRLRQIELDQARRKAILEEDTKLQALTMLRDSEQRELEALSKLKDSENKRMALTQFVGFLLDAKKNSKEPFAKQKLLVMEEDQAGEEKLLWDLLKDKKLVKAQTSPLGTKELLHVESSKTRGRSELKVSYRPVTRSFRKGLCAASPSTDAWPHLDSSPSMVNQTMVHKQASALLRNRKGTAHQ